LAIFVQLTVSFITSENTIYKSVIITDWCVLCALLSLMHFAFLFFFVCAEIIFVVYSSVQITCFSAMWR